MGLADEIADIPPPRPPGSRCSVAALYDRLDDEDRQAVADLIDGHERQAVQVAEFLARHDIDLPAYTIRRHRRRRERPGTGCRCE